MPHHHKQQQHDLQQSNPIFPNTRGISVPRVVIGMGVIGVCAAAYVSSQALLKPPAQGLAKGLTATAETGPLTVSIIEKGTIQALDPVILKSRVEGRVRILDMLPEGSAVNQGDVIIRLDSAELENKKIDLEIQVENARAEVVKEEKDLEITRNQAQADIAQAQLDLEFAQMDLKKYSSGQFPNDLKNATSSIQLAEADFQQAQDRYNGSVKLAAQNYISNAELESDKIKRNRAEVEVEKAREELVLLRKYTRIRTLRENLSNIEQNKLALDRVRSRAEANIVQAEVALAARKTELNRRLDELQRTEDQIQYCTIVAPRNGTVVYAPRHSRQDPLEEGLEVRENEELIHLPNSQSMMVEVKIHETFLDRIRTGQPAQITVDSLPGQVFKGTVARINSHPDQQQRWLNPDLVVYGTQIHFTQETAGLRSGMTGRVEVLVDHLPDTLQVPVQAVVSKDGQPTVWVVDETTGRTEPTPVTIGLDNDINVAITDGLEAGQLISLVPPLEQSATTGSNGGSKEWDAQDIAAARQAKVDLTRQVKLKPEDKLLLDSITQSLEQNQLNTLLPNPTVQAEAQAALDHFKQGQSPDISPPLRQAVEAGMVYQAVKMANSRGFLDKMIQDPALLAEAQTLASQTLGEQTPQVSPALKQSMMRKIQQFRGGARGGGGGGGRPGV